jgi:hypothetical protein
MKQFILKLLSKFSWFKKEPQEKKIEYLGDSFDLYWALHKSIANSLDYLKIDRNKKHKLAVSIIGAEVCQSILSKYEGYDTEKYILWLKAQRYFHEYSRKNDPNQKPVEDILKPTDNYTAELYYYGKRVWRIDGSGFTQYIDNNGSVKNKQD